jgi:hypothetical protein
MTPPEGIEQDTFTRYGQIVITQPRIQATRNIAGFVARDLHGSSLGAGFDVGYRHSGAPNADWRNKLVFITDGTLINWIVSGQIGNLSVIMIDEAHERSLNIDLILGLLKEQLPRYPHLKLIIASATINADLFRNFYGGPDKVALLKFKGLKQYKVDAYFPDYDNKLFKNTEISSGHTRNIRYLMAGKIFQLLQDIAEGNKNEGDILGFLPGEALIEGCISDLREMIAADPLLSKRGINCYPLYSQLPIEQQDQALAQKVSNICDKVLAVVNSTSASTTRIMALLLDYRSAVEACELIRKKLNEEQVEWIVNPIPSGSITFDSIPKQILVTTHDDFKRLQGTSEYHLISDRRIVIATNLAETSLTVDGIVYVVESGLIKESRWDCDRSASDLQPRIHSRAGCLQRMGRAGRVRDGEAHMLYTDEEFEDDSIFSPYAVPEIQRSPLEQVILKAKAAGIDDIEKFDWIERPPDLELKRAANVLRTMGALDEEGDITEFGLELESFITEIPLAGLLTKADRFACGVETATLAALLPMRLQGGLLKWDRNWDADSKYKAMQVYKGMAVPCRDDLEYLLKIYSVWAEAETLFDRDFLCSFFLLDSDQLQDKVAAARNQFLEMLSIGKKSDEDRPINYGMLDRVRIVLAVSLPETYIYRAVKGDQTVISSIDGTGSDAEISEESILADNPPDLFIALKRRIDKNESGEKVLKLSCLVKLDQQWLELRNLPDIELAKAINKAVLQQSVPYIPGVNRHRLFLDVNYPVGAIYTTATDDDGRINPTRIANPPLPVFFIIDGKDETSDDPVDVSGAETASASGSPANTTRRRLSDLTDPEQEPGITEESEFDENPESKEGKGRACPQLSQMTAAARWMAARKLRAVLS